MQFCAALDLGRFLALPARSWADLEGRLWVESGPPITQSIEDPALGSRSASARPGPDHHQVRDGQCPAQFGTVLLR